MPPNASVPGLQVVRIKNRMFKRSSSVFIAWLSAGYKTPGLPAGWVNSLLCNHSKGLRLADVFFRHWRFPLKHAGRFSFQA
ncbi:hypothetical protein D8M09_03335 [Enterobacter sp. R1(2018)]|nr:hypothetical protein D8M09_03335 [Enterobacter sp. R1(2018)]